MTGAGDTVIATFGAGARGRRVVLRGGAAGQLRRRPRRDEARHRHRVGARADGRRRRAITTPRTENWSQEGPAAGATGRSDGLSAKPDLTERAIARDRADGQDHRVRERLLRPPARRARPLPAGRGARGRSAGRRGQRRSIGRVAQGAGPADSVRRATARSSSPRFAAWTTSSSSATTTVERLLTLLEARRALQGHGLHRRHGSRARRRPSLRRPDRHRRRSQSTTPRAICSPIAIGDSPERACA